MKLNLNQIIAVFEFNQACGQIGKFKNLLRKPNISLTNMETYINLIEVGKTMLYNQIQSLMNYQARLGMASNLAEMVLQARINPTLEYLDRLQVAKHQLEQLFHRDSPTNKTVQFLIDHEFYQIRNKIAQKIKNSNEDFELVIVFTIYDKITSISERAEIWKLSINRKQMTCQQNEQEYLELPHLIKNIVEQLTSSQIFSDLAKNKEASKKYIIDFKIEVGKDLHVQQSQLANIGCVWLASSRIGNCEECNIACYWRKKINLPFIKLSPYLFLQNRKGKGISEETNDSCGSKGEISYRRYKSFDEHQQAFEVYDSDLDVTIISSNSESLSGSNHIICEMTLGQIDQFQLLIDQSFDDDQLFLIENECLFKEWKNYLATQNK